MLRPFVVISESVAVMTDLDNRFHEIGKACGGGAHAAEIVRRGRRSQLTPSKNGIERILSEDVFDVGD